MQPKQILYFYDDNKRGKTEPRTWVFGFLVLFFALIIAPYLVYGMFNFITRRLVFAGYLDNYTLTHFLGVLLDWLPSVVIYGLGIWFVQKHLRKRPLMKIITSAPRFRWKRLFAGALVFLFLTIVFLFVEALFSGGSSGIFSTETSRKLLSFDYRYHGHSLEFWMGLPIVLLFSPLNSAFQELVFRGFGDQGLTRYIPKKSFAFLVSAVVFALYHYGNPEMYYGPIPYLLLMVIFGFAMSVITSMDGGLEAAIGIHVANNLFYFLIIGGNGSGWVQTWLFSYELGPVTYKIVLLDLVFFFLCTYLLSIWRFGRGVEKPAKRAKPI